MSWKNKVIWSEGLFIRPQHFQQHERYLEALVENRNRGLNIYDWGLRQLEIDEELLSLGKIALKKADGIFSDGTPFAIPLECQSPSPLDVGNDINDEVVYLCLPLRRDGLAEVETPIARDHLTRYHSHEADVSDSNSGYKNNSNMQLAQLRIKLKLASEDRSQFSSIAIARIQDCNADRGVVLESTFIPPVLHCGADDILMAKITELQGSLRHRGEALAARVNSSSGGGVSEIADFMMLQIINRFEPLINHFAELPSLHPEMLYRYLIQLSGEMATFYQPSKRPDIPQPYQHERLDLTFDQLCKDLRQALNMVLEQNAIAITLEDKNYGVSMAIIGDQSLLKEAQFILAVKADLSPEVLQTKFPPQAKLGPAEHIRQLVNAGLPGIDLRMLPVAPRQIPYHAGFTYFELDKHSRFWSELEKTGNFAIHVSGDFPGLELEFWAIRG